MKESKTAFLIVLFIAILHLIWTAFMALCVRTTKCVTPILFFFMIGFATLDALGLCSKVTGMIAMAFFLVLMGWLMYLYFQAPAPATNANDRGVA